MFLARKEYIHAKAPGLANLKYVLGFPSLGLPGMEKSALLIMVASTHAYRQIHLLFCSFF